MRIISFSMNKLKQLLKKLQLILLISEKHKIIFNLHLHSEYNFEVLLLFLQVSDSFIYLADC